MNDEMNDFCYITVFVFYFYETNNCIDHMSDLPVLLRRAGHSKDR